MPIIQSLPQDIDVTDHAVVRWLERVCGVDIEKYRAEIRAAFAAGGLDLVVAHSDPDASIYIDVPEHGVLLVVAHSEVLTVIRLSGDRT